MKLVSPIALLTLVLSLQAYSSDLIKTLDGSTVECKTKYDLFRNNLSGVYRPLSVVKKDGKATITLELLRCETQDGTYGFVRDNEVEDRTVILKKGEIYQNDAVMRIQRKELTLTAFTGFGKFVDKKLLSKNEDGTYTATISIETLEYDPSPEGKKSLEIAIQSTFSLDELISGTNVDHGNEFLGSYRLVIE